MPDLRDFLVRVALDDVFRDLVRRAPDEAFSGYALDEAQRQTLRRPDASWLGLLGGAVREAAPEVHAPAPEVPPGPSLPEARLLLVLRPYAIPDTPGPAIGWAATLQPWPSEVDPTALSFVVRVTPQGVAVGDSLSGSYTATIQPAPIAEAPETSVFADGGGAPPDVSRAAAAVLGAPPAQRYDRIRDLLAALGGAP